MTLSSRISILKFIKLYLTSDQVFITHIVHAWYTKPYAFEYTFYMPNDEKVIVTLEYSDILENINKHFF